MGKGDKKSRKGKIFMGTYGVTRPRKTAEVIVMPKKKKVELKKEEVATKEIISFKSKI
ncbi:MAG: 30S ribosomal protein THX [Flavobacteriales bacterium]|jgi:30S ribosomal protein S31|nr:30S ribosomal protein THX [Flavobacteriales bacterium]MBT5615073.1 30S ribosomal protein THX [Flavobacteriales bacterium]MBT6965892.1 30S ribosomal protein THX [Flavobacteriales bacterium]